MPLSDFEVSQLTNQAECFIHTHPKVNASLSDVIDADYADIVVPVLSGQTLTAKNRHVTTSPSGTTWNIYLPSAPPGQVYIVTQLTAGTTVINAAFGELITGSSSYSLTSQWASVTLKVASPGLWIRI